MNKMRIALLQIMPGNGIEENLKIGIDSCKKAKTMGADHEPCSRDTLIIEAGEEEGIYIATFDIDSLRDYRKREVHGNAYRHPEKYKILVSEEINEPFTRYDYRKRT
ncbi:MAG: hypothetical protein A2015_09820 [Spirochaetes bacterium GWF1_31_7]|nr:MAG: hypothetical protein A2Y30_07205 [Spirochaetes bacterium GWE1_32_154]OHD45650.1 MAG: hypothetical protein A2Y29_15725 [Spirochaetes bacterium GWE2_31_10]OHD48221.1 MAG: hypothetical protein A2015_09820 [Spirochaetes bacterium GWF1_31_7]